ncbi:MAG: pyruvate dehydrogenase (acetyl-transferring) E1 component subunit alpha [Deltaproteobacteria bacterium]|nr:pyruvate dehydrogenase (acetyl-transferring) E1 component subunit alpha [Deltaproteobacteria bacterium]
MAKTEQAATCDAEATEQVGREKLRGFLQQMQLIRRFEERAAREYASGRISGFCHLYIGQEGVAVGALGALEPRDHVITAYRDHGHALLRGCTPRAVMAELMGKVTGAARGRGGSMHMFNPEQRFHGGHGIVGGHIPLATGFAFASAYEQRGDVTICFFGEGAMNQGAFYESLNLASLWNLPAVYVIENNQYAMGTPLSRASAISDLAMKATAFGMEGEVVDGMDVTLVNACIARAAKRAREEHRPTLIEARCYRFRGHSMSDPAKYRTKDEVDERKAHDPITLATHTLLERKWASEDEVKGWDDEAKDAAADAAEFAADSPQPSLSDLGRYVYAEPLSWRLDDAMTPHVREEG